MAGHEIEKDWTTAVGLRAVVVRCFREGSHWFCGYVEVPKDHPLFGCGYSEERDILRTPAAAALEQPIGARGAINVFCAGLRGGLSPTPVDVFDVHGSLTYSADASNGYPAQSDGWWFGFDCLHAGDDPHIHNEIYAADECERLAQQLASITFDGA